MTPDLDQLQERLRVDAVWHRNCSRADMARNCADAIALIAEVRAARERTSPSADAVEQKSYVLKVARCEDYSGEHREWVEEIPIPEAVVKQIQSDALAATATPAADRGLADEFRSVVETAMGAKASLNVADVGIWVVRNAGRIITALRAQGDGT